MIIADTGFFVALGNRRDRYHQAAMTALDKVKEPLITTYPVVTETCQLLQARTTQMAQCLFLQEVLRGSFQLDGLDASGLARVIELLERYADIRMDMADASLVVLAESLSHGRILTLDQRDFSVYRWGKNRVFENLLL